MRIEIAGWESSGLRCPDVLVDLRVRQTNPKKITLVQMPNGTGKTTTLELLKATLSGAAEHWDPDYVRSFCRSRDSRHFGTFRVTLLVDGNPLSIELQLNYSTGHVSFKTTNPQRGGVVNRYDVPATLNGFLTPEFLRLFIFDGEFAVRLLNDRETEADKVVDTICQLHLLRDASSFAHDHWETSAKSHTTKSQSGLDRKKRELRELEGKKKGLEKEFEVANAEIGKLEEEIGDLAEKIRNRVSSVESTRQQQAEAEASRISAESSVATERLKLMNAMRMPNSLHPVIEQRLKELHQNLDRLRLPENTSAQFFRELVCEERCICGRPMDEQSAKEIEVRAKRYLDREDAGVINAMKHDIESLTNGFDGEVENEGHNEALRLSESLSRVVREEMSARQLERTLTRKLIEAGDDELEQWENEKQQKEGRLEELRDAVAQFESKQSGDQDPFATRSIRVVHTAIEKAKDRIAEIEGTVRLRRQIELIQQVLDDAGRLARERIKQDLVGKCNERLAVVLANDPLIVERIDRSIKLKGQRGASAGQTLAISYMFLMTILSRGHNDFPLVVDSPAGPIDTTVRRHIARLLPELCTQFVGFTINTETKAFVEELDANVNDIRFLTLFRKTPAVRHKLQTLPHGCYHETESAVLVDDRSYYFDFDIEQEDSHAVDAR